MIKKGAHGGYDLKSKKTGKELGHYATKGEAKKREQQVNYFKSHPKKK